MDSGNKGFNMKQKIDKIIAKRAVKYANKEIARLKWRLRQIEQEKSDIELKIEGFQRGKQAIIDLELRERE